MILLMASNIQDNTKTIQTRLWLKCEDETNCQGPEVKIKHMEHINCIYGSSKCKGRYKRDATWVQKYGP